LAWLQVEQQQQQQASSSKVWLALSGGQDGRLKVWHGQSGAAVAEIALHVDRQGKGAVGGILTGLLEVICWLRMTTVWVVVSFLAPW
jgi:hypothetical protein